VASLYTLPACTAGIEASHMQAAAIYLLAGLIYWLMGKDA
jgi:hypothetical protein